MPERPSGQKIESYQKIIEGEGSDLVRADCPIHGEGVYFERVEGNLFQCANFEHKPENGRQRMVDRVPRRPER
jgi:hypothetical protein